MRSFSFILFRNIRGTFWGWNLPFSTFQETVGSHLKVLNPNKVKTQFPYVKHCYLSAYKKQHSTETALIRVHNDVLRALDNRQSVLLLLFDLSAAFDTVDHQILLSRLAERFGLTGDVVTWFASYLSERNSSFVYLVVSRHIVTCFLDFPKALFSDQCCFYYILRLFLTSSAIMELSSICRRHPNLYFI